MTSSRLTSRQPVRPATASVANADRSRVQSLSNVRFLTVSEVAKLMRVSKMTVYRLVHSQELTAVRVGRSFRVPESAVNEYLKDALPEIA